jgi:hypothetical protein
MSKRHKHSRTERLFTADDLEAAPRPASSEHRSGSIEQHLDMNESGPLRGEEILRSHGLSDQDYRQHAGEEPRPLDPERMQRNYNVDMSEDQREGSEEAGDEHSSGLQGSDQQELQYDIESPDHADSGAPGEMTGKAARRDPSQRGYRRRAA